MGRALSPTPITRYTGCSQWEVAGRAQSYTRAACACIMGAHHIFIESLLVRPMVVVVEMGSTVGLVVCRQRQVFLCLSAFLGQVIIGVMIFCS